MTKRTVHYAISCLFLLSAAVGATANAGSAESGQETGAGFRLIIDAPSRLRDILQSGLDISRWQGYVGMTLPLLQSLIRDARAQALEAAATEGYYNAQVAISIDDVQQGRRTVHLQVTPNERQSGQGNRVRLAARA